MKDWMSTRLSAGVDNHPNFLTFYPEKLRLLIFIKNYDTYMMLVMVTSNSLCIEVQQKSGLTTTTTIVLKLW